MKNTKILAMLTLCITLCFAGCGRKETVESTKTGEPVATISPVTEDTISSPLPIESYEDTEQPPSEGMVRSRITNKWIDEKINNTRPVALMIPNSSSATFYGLGRASVLYECNVEGSMTRLMGIFEDWQDCEKLGNIRSCRDYFVYWAFEWDAIYIHYGGPFYINDVVGRDDTQNINCINYPNISYRDEAKNSTDNAFTSSDRIKEAMEHYAYPMTYRSGYCDDQHYLFAPTDTPNNFDGYDDVLTAKKIDMSRCYPVTNCYFLYDSNSGQYLRYQNFPGVGDSAHIDEETGLQLSFKNIIVQNTYHEVRDQKGYLAFQVHDNTRDGWFFTNGKGIHVTWKKESDYGATKYYDDYGNEIMLNTGKTMVLIVEDGDVFTVDDTVIASPK